MGKIIYILLGIGILFFALRFYKKGKNARAASLLALLIVQMFLGMRSDLTDDFSSIVITLVMVVLLAIWGLVALFVRHKRYGLAVAAILVPINLFLVGAYAALAPWGPPPGGLLELPSQSEEQIRLLPWIIGTGVLSVCGVAREIVMLVRGFLRKK